MKGSDIVEHTPYDDLINFALDKKDFEWVKELVKLKDTIKESELIERELKFEENIDIIKILKEQEILEPYLELHKYVKNLNTIQRYQVIKANYGLRYANNILYILKLLDEV
jgi:hypothetical protein